MKKVLILAVIVFALAFSAIAATDAVGQKPECDNVVSANVWPYLGAFFNLGYERDLVANLSVRVRGEYWGLSQGGFNLGGYGIDLFYHPMGKGLDGWYFGPRFDQWIVSYSGNGTTGSGSLYWVGAQAGYRWIFDGGFEMAVSLGAQKNIAASITYNNSTTNETPPFNAMTLPVFDYDLGYAF
ncbi:MAG: hypothetical protein ABSA34_04990 [Candidatus Goldiibacteriota bacterium]